jgi:murein DD-endopeptidase MepM/ murein hydrolase activator NlpD
MTSRVARLVHLLPLAAILAAGCGMGDRVEALFDTRSARERYEAGLALAGLGKSALVLDWQASAQRALAEAPQVTTPHIEEGVLGRADVGAFAFRVSVRRGQEVTFAMQLHGDSASQVFLDVWEADSAGALRLIASADSGRRSVSVEPRRAGEYVFRAQPEMLRGGRFTLRLGLGPSLAFPVQGAGTRDIRSGFGAPREGGARDHQGIDIFARRGTPVLAAASGVVTRVGTSGLGGNIVWLRDDRGNRHYYAHLDRYAAYSGQEVSRGDTIGFVGNTGNARTTPPHLHFGVYRRGEGALDPRWFVSHMPATTMRLAADTALLGALARTRRATEVKHAPRAAATVAVSLPPDAAVQVLTAVGQYYRVRLADGRTGYVVASRLTSSGAGQPAVSSGL